MSSSIDRLRLLRTDGVGPITYRRLLDRYPTPSEALDALPALARAGGRATAPTIPTRASAERELDALHAIGARLIFLDDPAYPSLLALLPDAPPALAVLGNPAHLSAQAVGVVGARNASLNGRRFAGALGTDLAQAGLAVVSGLARGIDAAAHEGALPVGITIAAVAGGLDVPYPPEHAALQARIAECGAVVAEAPLGTAPQGRHFPKRNRVIAGLSLGLVVVEAALHSGSLITASFAQEAGREVFAVPGSPLDERSRGSNNLLRQGACLVECAADVIANLPDHPAEAAPRRARPGFAEPGAAPRHLDPSESEAAQARCAILSILGPSPAPVDDLIRHCHLSASAAMAALMQLELAGRVEALPGNRVSLIAPA